MRGKHLQYMQLGRLQCQAWSYAGEASAGLKEHSVMGCLAQVSALVGGAAAGALLGGRPVTLAAGATAGAAVGVLAHVATFRCGEEAATPPLNPKRIQKLHERQRAPWRMWPPWGVRRAATPVPNLKAATTAQGFMWLLSQG